MRAVRDAATVMLVRDRPALQVFVVRRNPEAVFGPGASVFPGGAVDPGDSDHSLAARTVGLDDLSASRMLGLEHGALARWHAAARECFEESGVLLARGRSSLQVPDLRDPGRAERLVEWRHALNRGDSTWSELLEHEDLVLDTNDLVVFAHWLTPVGPPRRYDTWFFVAAAPDGQDGVHDDAELVESEWITPADALERYERRDIDLIFPTWRSLVVLSRYQDAGGLLDDVTRAVTPDGFTAVVADGSGERVRLRDDEAPATRWTIPLPEPRLTADRALARAEREGAV